MKQEEASVTRLSALTLVGAILLGGCSPFVPMATGSAGGEGSFVIDVPTEEPASTPAPTVSTTPEPTAAARPLPDDLASIPHEGDQFSFEVAPLSEAGTWPVGATGEIELGHCGLSSPIDLDGSLWDPRFGHDGNGGPLNGDQLGDVINEGPASFTLLDEFTAEMVTEHGAVITLWRHMGPRYYWACA
jgi:hypothetical protein